MNTCQKKKIVLYAVRMPLFLMLGTLSTSTLWAQQAPPELGQETKGTPAVNETTGKAVVASKKAGSGDSVADQSDVEGAEKVSGIDTLLGKAAVTESKRENGQVYLIELEHSSGAKQYIEENDSDGKIESTSNDIEETPNLPKWKLGSW